MLGVSPRSGTTLLAEAMVACFEIDLFHDHEARIFSPPPSAGDLYLTKAPRDILLAEAALERSSELIVVHMLRDHPRFVVVRYEDLVADADAVQSALMARMPFLTKTESFSDFHKVAKPSSSAMQALNGVRPISAEGAHKWRKHLARVAGQIAQHGSIAEDLIEFGYDRNDAWLRELDDIEPDRSSSHWPEYFTKESIARMLRAP